VIGQRMGVVEGERSDRSHQQEQRMNKTRLLATAALALTGVLGMGAAKAADVSWSVTIGSNGPLFPAIIPAPVVVHPVPVVRHVPVVRPVPVVHPMPVYYGGYRHPTRWDRDGDGVPNHADRLYNPSWDRDGDGIPNQRDRFDNRRHDRDGDGIPNRYDRRY
jgi:hypothetical protein